MLKVLYLPINTDTVQQGMYDAWTELGIQFEVCDFYRIWCATNNRDAIHNDFVNKARQFQPDLIHMQLQFTGLVLPRTLQEVRSIVPNAIMTNWTGDMRAEIKHEFTSIAPYVNYSLMSSTGQLDMYKKAGVNNAAYWQIGVDPKIAFPLWKTDFSYDISFAANHYNNIFPDSHLRLSAANHLTSTFGSRFGLFGGGFGPSAPTKNFKEMNDIYNSSICVLSISNYNNVAHYFSDRLLLCMSSGRPTISWYFPGYEDYFKDGEHLFIAKSNDDIVRIVDYCKQNIDKAGAVGKAGYEKIIQEHTYKCRVIELLKMINLIDKV